MNREIKFRGQMPNSNQWIFFDVIEYFKNDDMPKFLEYQMKNIGQYTGFKDFEGKEIYEGDIILGYNNPHVVNFVDGAFFITYKNSSIRLSRICGALKIIGNIYENPELT